MSGVKLELRYGLPFISATIVFRGNMLTVSNVLLDTGSRSSIFSANEVETIQIIPEPNDPIHRIRGVGGYEFVFSKRLDRITVGAMALDAFDVEIGAMDYGFDLNGILGMDFLRRINAVIDLSSLELDSR